MQILWINLAIAVVSVVISFAVRALVAVISTKDYFNRHVRAAVRLGFIERQIEIDGETLEFSAGLNNGPPLLLIPGQGCTWQEYSKALPGLVNSYHIVIVDVPGHGKSSWNPELYHAVKISDLMASFIRQLFDGPVFVAGHSSGGLFGPVWPVFTRAVLKERNKYPGQPPIVRWLPININRIWETQCHPFDLNFAQTFADNSWFKGFDQAQTLSAIKCPTVFLKATTRFDKQGNLLAALSDDDLKRIESLLPNNHTIRVKSSHDIHFARTKTYQNAINALLHRVSNEIVV